MKELRYKAQVEYSERFLQCNRLNLINLPVGLENMCGCHTRMTLSTPPVAMILALTQ